MEAMRGQEKISYCSEGQREQRGVWDHRPESGQGKSRGPRLEPRFPTRTEAGACLPSQGAVTASLERGQEHRGGGRRAESHLDSVTSVLRDS